MGEVYRARDPRLGRDVAIKVLPTAFSADVDRLRRFEQEARAAAALNHPNILAVHDIGTEAGAPFIVSELLEGETLRDRLNAGPIAVRKALELRASHRAWPRGGAREGDHASRSQARECVRDPGQPRQDSRLRSGEADAGSTSVRTRERDGHGAAADAAGCRARHRRLHGARAGAWTRRSIIARICLLLAPFCTSSCPAGARFPATRRLRRWRRSSRRIRRTSTLRRQCRRPSSGSSIAVWRRVRRRDFRRPAISRSRWRACRTRRARQRLSLPADLAPTARGLAGRLRCCC